MATKEERLAKLRERINNIERPTGNFTKFFKPEADTTTTIRILPEVGNMEVFFQEVGRHKIPGKDQLVYCPAFTTLNELDCPVCELISDLYKGSKQDVDLAKEMKLQCSYWMNIIVRGQESEGVQIYTPGIMVFDQIRNIIADPDYGDVTDIKEGVDIAIERIGSKMTDTRYDVRAKRHSSPLHEDDSIVKRWLNDAEDLTVAILSDDPEEDTKLKDGRRLWVLPYERLLEELNLDGLGSDDEEEDDDFSRRKTRSRRR